MFMVWDDILVDVIRLRFAPPGGNLRGTASPFGHRPDYLTISVVRYAFQA